MKKMIQAILFLLAVGTVAAQTPGELTVGDRMPDLAISSIFNHESDFLHLEDYRGKVIILDFWNPYCVSCLTAFPKIDSLQRTFMDQVQIIAVSKTSYEKTIDFFASHPNVHLPSIPFITGDTLLSNLFPHVGDPYHVWIDQNGVVIHLASGSFLTKERLQRAIEQKPTDIPIAPKRVKYLQTLLDTAFDQETAYASYLVHYNYLKGFRIEKPTLPNEYTSSGTIKTHYQRLYQQLGDVTFNPLQPGRTLILTKDPSRYELPVTLTGELYMQWMNKNAYFYQGRIPLADSARLFEWVLADFERYFGLIPTVEKRLVESWILIRTDSIDRLKTSGGKKLHTFVHKNIYRPSLPDIRQLRNFDYNFFSSVVTSSVERISNLPCFDKTGYVGNVDVQFSAETLDYPTIENLREDLQRHGLDLVKVDKALDVLILREVIDKTLRHAYEPESL